MIYTAREVRCGFSGVVGLPVSSGHQTTWSDTSRRINFPVVRKLGKLSLIGLSTACVTPVFMASGKLGNEQLQRLDKLLQQAVTEGQMVVLLIHHPPLPGMTNWRKALVDASALQAVLEHHPPLLIFYGHLHHNHGTTVG